jgi:RHS repeat-associated protein
MNRATRQIVIPSVARNLLLTFMLALVASSLASAQVPTGTPPFGSFGGGPDVINLANLNSHLTVPVLHKPGRGTNFSYDLSYDSSVWYPVGSSGNQTWQPVANWGWTGVTQALAGYVSSTETTTTKDAGFCRIMTFSNYSFHDIFGTAHNFNGSYLFETWDEGGGQNRDCFTQNLTTLARDGSGLKLQASVLKSTIIFPDGTSGIPGASVTDRNGNQNSVSSSNGTYTFTDTLGTHVLAVTGAAPSNTTFTYTAPNGQPATYTMSYVAYTVATNFTVSGINEYGATATNLVDRVTLPDTSFYQFTYEQTPSTPGTPCSPKPGTFQTYCVTARIHQVTLPAGGTITYNYSGGAGTNNSGIFNDGSTASLQRVLSDGGGWSGTWTYAQTKGTGAASATLITAPQLSYDSAANQIIAQFQGIYETQGNVYQGTAPTFTLLPIAESTLQTSNLLQETKSCYNASVAPCTGTVITLPILRRTATVQLNSGLQCAADNFFNAYGLPTETDEYDYGTTNGITGPLLRKTSITYASLGNNINASQQVVTVTDSLGHIASQTTYNYDETAVQSTTGTPQHIAVSGSRGNLTTVKILVQGTTSLSKTYTYYDTGNVNVAKDYAGAQTTYTYGACVNSLATKQTTANGSLSLSNSMTWDCTSGALTSVTDTNNQTSNYTYDNFSRVMNIKRPDAVQLTYQYPTTSTPTYLVTVPIQGSNSSISTTTFDGLGRPVRSSISDSSPHIVDTQYDSLGRTYKVSNPYATSAQYWSSTQFDALGRVLSQSEPDGAKSTYVYSGRTTTVTDPALKQKSYDYDEAGRIVNALEPDVTNNNALTVKTSYTYTGLDQISSVTQGVQSRSYSYDLMGRLTNVVTPESGQISFQFNNAGLVSQRTDARGVITKYVYDGLSRLTGKNYTIPQGNTSAAMPNVCDPAGNPTPSQSVCYFYDQGGSSVYALGRLTKVVDASGSNVFTFDQLGRTTQTSKTVGSKTYNTTYAYNLANEVTSVTYPSLRVVQFSYDAIGRPCAIGASGSTCSTGTTYANNFTYNVASQLTGVTYGGGVSGTFGYSPDRLQLTSIGYAKGAQTLLGLNYWYGHDSTNCANGVTGNNGQLQCITDSIEPGRDTSYTYDALYRLSGAVTQGATNFPKWGLSWSYDRYGNRLSQTPSSGCVAPMVCPGNSLSFSTSGGALTNRQDSMCFDANGNLLAETAPPCPAPTYVYDGENRLVNYQNASYTYDSAGMRVTKQASGTTAVYIFSGSKVIAEYDNGAAPSAPSREYIYSGAGLLAKFESGVTTYFNNDYLSARLLTDSSGNVIGQRGNYPFGETWYETGTTTKWKFATYERDAESTNDYALARSFVYRFGRFSSPDPLSGGLNDPQSLNRYAYAANDPCNHADPLGLASSCTLNVKLNSGAGVSLSDADKAAITDRINILLTASQVPNGDGVQIQTSYSGNTDYTLNFQNTGGKAIELGNLLGFTLGDALIGAVVGYVYPDAIHQARYRALGTMSLQSIEGGVGLHELVHMSAKFADEQYSTLNTNIMMTDFAPKAANDASFSDPNSALWMLTPQQVEAMYQDCIKKHPPKPPAKASGKHGGGGGGGGGGGHRRGGKKCELDFLGGGLMTSFIWCDDGSGCVSFDGGGGCWNPGEFGNFFSLLDDRSKKRLRSERSSAWEIGPLTENLRRTELENLAAMQIPAPEYERAEEFR